jgi:hypothetical protein
MRNPGQDVDQHQKNSRRFEREDLVQRFRDIQREVDALRPSYRGKPMPEIVSMLENRFGSDLDTRTLDRCAQAFMSGESVEISPPPAPSQRSGGPRRRS